MSNLKERFCELLRSTNREGGLVEHSLNVCEMALMLRESMILKDPDPAAKLPYDGFGKGCIDAIEAFMRDNGLNGES